MSDISKCFRGPFDFEITGVDCIVGRHYEGISTISIFHISLLQD